MKSLAICSACVELNSSSFASQTSYSTANCFTFSGDTIANMSVSANGAGIYISNSGSNLSVYDCFFYSCKATSSSSYGGAIYFSGYSFNANRSCATCCYATFTGMFLYSYANGYNTLSISSSLKCCPSSEGDRSPIRLHYGCQEINKLNVSFSKIANIQSGIIIAYDTTSVTTFSTFLSNYAGSGITINNYDGSSAYCFNKCNIINNSCGSSGKCVIFSDSANTNLTGCIIQSNNPTIIFECTVSTTLISLFGCLLDSYVTSGSAATDSGCLITNATAIVFNMFSLNHICYNGVGYQSSPFTNWAKNSNYLMITGFFTAFLMEI